MTNDKVNYEDLPYPYYILTIAVTDPVTNKNVYGYKIDEAEYDWGRPVHPVEFLTACEKENERAFRPNANSGDCSM